MHVVLAGAQATVTALTFMGTWTVPLGQTTQVVPSALWMLPVGHHVHTPLRAYSPVPQATRDGRQTALTALYE